MSFENGEDSVTVGPGGSVALSFDYKMWNRQGCPDCIVYLPVGIEDDAQDAVDAGIPWTHPGASVSGQVEMTAPESQGTYPVYTMYAADVSAADAMDRYESWFPRTRIFQIATIEVEG